MHGKLLMAVVFILVVAVAVPTALAALGDNQKQELRDLYLQILDVQKQIIQKKVQFGILTQQQGDQLIRQLEESQKYLVNDWQAENESAANPADPDAGYGCGGGDRGTTNPANITTGFTI